MTDIIFLSHFVSMRCMNTKSFRLLFDINDNRYPSIVLS